MKKVLHCVVLFGLVTAFLAGFSVPGQGAGLGPVSWSADQRESEACHDSATGPYVRLINWEFDPLCQSQPIDLPVSLQLADYPEGQMGYYLVQFNGPILPEWKDAVNRAGAVLLDYIPDFTFVTRMDSDIRDRVASLPMIRWIGIYQPGYRLAPSLLAEAKGVTEEISWPSEVQVVLFPGEDVSVFQRQIQGIQGEIQEITENALGTMLTIGTDRSALIELASIQGVRWIEPVPEWTLFNNRAADVMTTRSTWDSHSLYGAGQIVAVCDTGLDQGSTSPANLHNDFEDGSGNSRVLQIIDRVGDGAHDTDSGHGTHVAGSVLGNGDISGSDPTTHYYPSASYAGSAPEASLVFQAVEDADGYLTGIPDDLTFLFQQAYEASARIHSNSWGSAAAGTYTTDSHNADLFIWNNRDFSILFSAGNDGTDTTPSNGFVDPHNLGSPASAKNCITVGATENNRSDMGTGTWGSYWPDDFPNTPISTDPTANNPVGMAAFSSRGSTVDGRYKPDIVAPGTYIASTKSSAMSGECGWGDIDTYYCYMGGTSMSTPLTSGALALIRQYYTQLQGITPSAALLKATLANGATELSPGQYVSPAEQPTTRPNNVEGWGRVNIETSLFPSNRALDYWDFAEGIQTGEYDTFDLNMSATQPFRTTLAWTDYPGALAAGGGLVNDLDLDVTLPGSAVQYPNNANRRGATQFGFHDTDPWDLVSTRSNRYYAVKLTPTAYPSSVDKALFFSYSVNMAGSLSYPINYLVRIYDDNGSGGSPSTLLYGPVTVRVTMPGWVAVPISGVTINSGSFYVAVQPGTDRGSRLTEDEAGPSTASWLYNSGWSLWTGRDLNIRAVMVSPDYSTNYDRTNNLVGIDIDSPTTTGDYTVRVAGYNVAQSPQPFAVVTSAAASFAGASSYRIFAGGNTALRTFGRTGVQMDFASGPGGNVTITMSKTAPANPPPTGKAFLDVNWDISSGMSGFSTQIVFHYDETDLPAGITENMIMALRWNSGTSSWDEMGGTVDTNANTVTVSGVTAFSNWALGGNSPTAVTLARFEAWPAAEGIRLEWETATEIDHLGFNLYRSSGGEDRATQKLNEVLIASQAPGSPTGAVYTWTDASVEPGGTYYYELEDVDLHGVTTRHGPVAAAAFWRVYLPVVLR